LYLPPEQPALLVDLLFPDLDAQQGLLARSRKAAGHGDAEADLDRLAGSGMSLRACEQRKRSSTRRKHTSQVSKHIVPPSRTYLCGDFSRSPWRLQALKLDTSPHNPEDSILFAM